MKNKNYLILLLVLCMPISGKAQLGALFESQDDAVVDPTDGSNTNVDEDVISNDVVTTQPQNCPESEQNSIPLKFINKGLLRQRNASVQVSHDGGSGKLRIKGGRFIANCQDMLQWGVRKPNDAQADYLVELKIKKPADCAFNECSYTVMKKGGVEEKIKFEPTYSGFISCLEHTGVLSKNDSGEYSVVKDNIVERDMDQSISGIDKTAKVRFVSYGPEAQKIGPAYEKVSINQCYYVEKISSDDVVAYSKADWELNEQALEVNQLCKSNDYRSIFENIDKYSAFESQLREIGAKLLEEDVKKLAKAIQSAKTGDDLDAESLSLVTDFKKYIIDPLTQKITLQFKKWNEMANGPEKQAAYEELKKLRAKLEGYKQSPYLTATHQKKLKTLGKFSQAKELYLTQSSISQYANVGKTYNGTRFTPELAVNKINAEYKAYESKEPGEIRDYEILTCERSGDASRVSARAQAYEKRITTRTQNYQEYVNNLIAQMQQQCSKYYVNQSKCIQQFTQIINNCKIELRDRNALDRARADKLKVEATRLAGVEAKAGENCKEEEVVADTDIDGISDDLSPSFDFDFTDTSFNQTDLVQQMMAQQQQGQQPGAYNFNFNNGGMNQGNYQGNYQGQFNTGFNGSIFGQSSPWGNNGFNNGGSYYYGSNNNQFPYRGVSNYNGFNGGAGINFGANMGGGNYFGNNYMGGNNMYYGVTNQMPMQSYQPGGAFNFGFQ